MAANTRAALSGNTMLMRALAQSDTSLIRQPMHNPPSWAMSLTKSPLAKTFHCIATSFGPKYIYGLSSLCSHSLEVQRVRTSVVLPSSTPAQAPIAALLDVVMLFFCSPQPRRPQIIQAGTASVCEHDRQ
jgi:hypothetical protein